MWSRVILVLLWVSPFAVSLLNKAQLAPKCMNSVYSPIKKYLFMRKSILSMVTEENGERLEKDTTSLEEIAATEKADKEKAWIETALKEAESLLDVEMYTMEETFLDQSITRAVKQLVESPPSEPVPTPLEKFESIFLNRKKKRADKEEVEKLDADTMLQQLFETPAQKDPFDERKVMIKLRYSMDVKDFEDIFKDPAIGDLI